MVRRGLAASRAQAQEQIAARSVLVGGAVAEKAARLVDPGEALEVLGPGPAHVSRAGEKLAAALEAFELDPAGWRVLDAGASTGGFTDALLQRGAASVVAVDVGHGQLHERLRADARVEVHERTDVRDLAPALEPVDLVVADLSFISLRLVVDALLAPCRLGGPLVLLVKPQFEAGREEAGRGRGVIRDPLVWRRTLHEVIDALVERGATIMGVMASPVRGASGNVEFLVHARAHPATGPRDPAAMVDEAVRTVEG